METNYNYLKYLWKEGRERRKREEKKRRRDSEVYRVPSYNLRAAENFIFLRRRNYSIFLEKWRCKKPDRWSHY